MLRYVGQNGVNVCRDAGRSQAFPGQCKQTVNCALSIASGGRQYPTGGSDYNEEFRLAGGIEQSSANATKGDIIQVQTSSMLHTAVIVSNLGNNRFNVVDSNWNGDLMVKQHDWTLPSGARIWRMGATSIFVPLDTPRWMQIKNDNTFKFDVIKKVKAGDPLSAKQQLYFIDKAQVNGRWYLRTEFNYNDGGSYGIAQDELEEIPYKAITPKWMTFIEDGNRSHPASRTSIGDSLVRGTSVKVVDQIVIDGNVYYRTEYNHNNNQDVGIHSRFLVDFAPIPLDSPRNFCTTGGINKIDPTTNQVISTGNAGTFMINKKTLINGIWYYQTSSDNGTMRFFDSSDLHECYVPFDNPRSMRLNQDAVRFNPFTNEQYDVLPKGQIISLSTKILLDNQWYYRTTYNTQNNTDAVIPASAFSEL